MDPKYILDTIHNNTSEEIFSKIMALENNVDYIQSLIFEAEMIYNEKEKNSLSFDVEEMKERLHKIFLEERISLIHKELDLAKDSEKKDLLQKIQVLTQEKNGT
jgi:hypothetical protein